MIQLSDTKAAPGLGALLGAKPKAGGDASAFALAFGSLAADGPPGFSITLPRQAIAASGSPLPDDESDVEIGSGIGAEIGLILAGTPMVPDAKVATPDGTGMEGEPVSVETPKPLATVPTASKTVDDRSDRIDVKTGQVTAQVTAPPTSTTAANAKTATTSTLPSSVEPTQIAVDKVIDIPAETPGDPNATPRSRAAGAPVSPVGDMREPVTTVVAEAPHADSLHKVSITTAATPIPVTLSAAPQTATTATTATARPEPTVAAAPSAMPASTPPQTKAVTSSPIASEAALPVAARTIPTDRPALAVRLQAAPANAAASRREATTKPPLDSAVSAVVPAPVAKVEAPMPAKFMSIERPGDAPSDRAAPRRIAVTPVIPAATPATAKPMTVADLIPVEHRPRMSATSIALVTDPASVGLSAPVEAPSKVADLAPLDTQATDWIEGMIEQIDVMRDAHAEGASETTTTRIRLSPDALGGIEIVLSGEGEAIDVRINADTSAARTLLAEAAPRLTDLAEARGLKLAQGDAGQSGQNQAQRQQSDDQPVANRRRSTDSAENGGNPDERIA